MADFSGEIPVSTEKILLVWDRIGDYHAARFLALEKIRPGVQIADLGGADQLYQWKNPLSQHPGYHSLSSRPVEENDLSSRLKAFKNLVKKENIRVVGIAGYGRPEYRKMLLWCRLQGIHAILFAESWYPGKLDFFKGLYLNWLCHGFLVSGIRARQHFRQHLGIHESRILLPYSVVDNAHFRQAKPDYSTQKILCLARFSPEKNLENLLKAYTASGIHKLGWTLELVGGGPLAETLKNSAGKGVHFSNWVAYAQLPELYGSASFFILPSSFEPWGLVVNEAMAAGLPIALSDACGCAPDLLSDPAWQFPIENTEAMAEIFRKIASTSAEYRMSTGMANRKKIEAFSPDAWADAFCRLAAMPG